MGSFGRQDAEGEAQSQGGGLGVDLAEVVEGEGEPHFGEVFLQRFGGQQAGGGLLGQEQ